MPWWRRLPAGKMDDLRVGGAVIVSSTKGTQEGKITAIMLLANAEMFVQLMRQQAEGKGDGMEKLLKGHGINSAQFVSLPAIFRARTRGRARQRWWPGGVAFGDAPPGSPWWSR